MSTPEFYREARAYDIAFGDRDFADECNFLAWCVAHRGEGQAKNERSFIELAAGPARHAREFAKRGWRSVALDLSADMIDYARSRAALEDAAPSQVEFVQGDMCDFALARPVALAANLMESISHLVTNEQIVAHFRAVSANLLPGGVFVIESAHPDSIWRDNLPNIWTREEDDMRVEITFGLADDPYDWISQQWTVTTQLVIQERGQPQRATRHRNQHRWLLPQEFRALVDLSGAFSRAAWYGDMVLPAPPLDNSEDSPRLIAVLTK